MTQPLLREIRTRAPLTVRRIPFLARFYRYAFHHQASRKKDLFVHVPLQKLFRAYRGLAKFPHWGEFDYHRLGRTSTVRFDATNLQFQALYGRVYLDGYEQELAALLDVLLSEGGTFFDIGSNWGYLSLYAASDHRQLSIHAFEPHPSTFRDLAGCVTQAGLDELATCHNLALSNRDGEAFIHFPDGLHSGSAEVNTLAQGTQITMRRLDSLPLRAPDVIKMDVEGHELEALQGATATLQSARPFIVFENKRNYQMPAQTLGPLQFLAGLGYEFFIPAVKRAEAAKDYFLPCGYQEVIRRVQAIKPQDCLALVPFEPATRFLFQHDLNVLASHTSRRPQLDALFHV